MKLLVTVVFLVVVFTRSSDGVQMCQVAYGKFLDTFFGVRERVTVPCKYNAIRALQCGSWRVTISPVNQLDPVKNKRYIVSSLFLGVQNVHTGLKWKGTTDLDIARKYLQNLKDAPFNKKDGALLTGDVFNYSAPGDKNEVSMTEKNGDFKVTFGLFDPEGQWHRSSGFSFDCFSDTFVPNPFPKQLCGNATGEEVVAYKRENGWEDNRKAVILVNIFTNVNIGQPSSDCRSASKTMTYKCNEDQQFESARLCWPLVGEFSYRNCTVQAGEKPMSAFRHCVEFVCSDYTDPNACQALSRELGTCTLAVISDKLQSTCGEEEVTNPK